jgi:hypothetical protein
VFPKGQRIAIIEPYYKVMADGTRGVRVDNPAEVWSRVDDQLNLPGAATDRDSMFTILQWLGVLLSCCTFELTLVLVAHSAHCSGA